MPCRASFLPRSKRHSRVARDPTEGGRPRIIYVSYDGAGEPLGRSQVLGYLTRLASAYDITLISFEKADEARTRVHDELIEVGIDWIPMRYHRRPAVLSTMLDLLAGRRALIGAARRREPAIVHVRSYVPALMALLARRRTKGKLLFDIRGFWVDERVDGGLWRPGGLLYRVAKRCERRFYAEADAIVTLTQASVTQVRVWAGARPVPIQVIPTCVDLQRFARRPERPGGPHVVWIGSIGTWYRFDLTARLASALSLLQTSVYAGLIASGWHTAAMMMRIGVDHFIDAESSLGSPGLGPIRWKLPVRPGDVLRVRARILESRRSASKPDRGSLTFEVEVVNGADEVVMVVENWVGIIRTRPG